MKRFQSNTNSPAHNRTYSKSSGNRETSEGFRPRKALLNHPSDDRTRREKFSSHTSKNGKSYPVGRSSNFLRELSGTNSSRSDLLGAGRVDPMLAAATAAAAMVNLGLVPPTSTDFSGLNSGANSSTASAVAALALNAAAMAAALGVGGTSSTKSLLQSTSNSRSLPSGSSSNYRRSSNYSSREESSRDRWQSGSHESRNQQSIQRKHDRDREDLFNARFPHHLDHRDPEDDPTATRTLFVGNLMPEITEEDLRSIFERYGYIEDIDIKRRDPESGVNAYAFIRFINLDMAHRAKVDMSGQLIGQFTCKIGYGKVSPTRCLWIGGLGPWITYPEFANLVNELAPTEKIIWPSGKNFANILFPNVEQAVVAADALRGYPLGGPGRRIRVDYTDESHMTRNPLKRARANMSEISRHGADRASRDSFSPREEFGRNGNGYRSSRRDYRSGHGAVPDRSFNEPYRKRFRSSRDRSSRYDSRRSPSSPQSSRKHSRSPRSRGENRTLSARPASTVQSASSVDELATCLPLAWEGAFFLKSSSFPCRMHILRGDQTLVDQFMSLSSLNRVTDNSSNKSPPTDIDGQDCLRITQRMKLDPLKLDDVSQRISAAGNSGFCVLLAVPSIVTSTHESHNHEDVAKQPQRPLRNLISYLRTKDSAGVVILGPTSNSQDPTATGVLHAFPPCDFAFSLLKERALALVKETAKDDHLVILLIRNTSAA